MQKRDANPRLFKMAKLKAELGGQSVTVNYVSKAETKIIRLSHKERFPMEFDNLEKGKAVKSNSNIFKLDPVMENGLLKGSHALRSKTSCDFVQRSS